MIHVRSIAVPGIGTAADPAKGTVWLSPAGLFTFDAEARASFCTFEDADAALQQWKAEYGAFQRTISAMADIVEVEPCATCGGAGQLEGSATYSNGVPYDYDADCPDCT